MNHKLNLILGALLLTLAFAVPAIGADTISNADVVEMTRAGLTPDVVIAKINTSPTSFDLSTRAILQLNENGVNDQVIKAMLDSTLAQPPAPPSPANAAGERLRAELAALASGTPEAREAALAWFVANRDTVAPDLRSFLSEANPANRAAAALALGKIGDTRSVGQIRNLLTDPAPEARRSAAQALSLLGDQPAVMAAEQAIQRGINPIDGYIRLVGYAKLTQMSSRLGEILATDSEAVNRSAAAWALGEIGRAGVAGRPALERALSSDTEPEVRREAALAIAKFNDSAAAASLQNACRLDPAVRKTTLTALAEYPEAVEFLIGVLGLAADQISVDETEAARTSLVRLTGQDFGLDGQRWREWYGSNGARFAAAAPSSFAAPSELDSLTIFDPSLAGPQYDTSRAQTGHVDMMEAWSIVADSAAIPTAPLPGEAAAAPSWGGPVGDSASVLGSGPGGGPSWNSGPSGGTPWSSRPSEGLPSWSGASAAPAGDVDISGTAASLSPGGQAVSSSSVPTAIPDVDIPEDERAGGRTTASGPSASGTSGLRTWSSDPDRLARGGAPARETTENNTGVPGWTPILQDVRSTLAQPSGQAGGAAGSQAGAGDSSGRLSADTVIVPPSASPPSPAPAPAAVASGSGDQFEPIDSLSAPPSLLGTPMFGDDDEPAFATQGQAADREDSESDAYGSSPRGFGDGGPVLDPNPYADLSDILGGGLPSGSEENLNAPALDQVLRSDSYEPWSIASGSSVPAAPALPEEEENYTGPDPYGEWSQPPPDQESSLEAVMPNQGDSPWSVPSGSASSAEDDPYAEWSAGLPQESGAVVSGQDDVTRVEDPYADWQEYTGDAFPQESAASAMPPAPSIPADETAASEIVDGDAFEGVDPAAIVESETPVDPGYRTDLFVEPEPDQVVITDDFPQGRPMMDVPQPSAPMPAPDAVPPPAMAETASPFPSGDTVVAETVPGGDMTLEVAPGTAVVVETAPAQTTTSSSASEPFRSTSPVAVEPPPPGQQPDMSGGPQTQYLAPPPGQAPDGSSSSNFMDPSRPLPPVRPEGTIAAPSGKTVPLLGEGFF